MVNLTFGEQVKIILGRKGMTIKELAELMEQRTGKPMSRQNMTQRLGRDNFQEQDMRLIAEILGCKFTLSIMEMDEAVVQAPVEVKEAVQAKEEDTLSREITIGELADMAAEVDKLEAVVETESQEDAGVELETAEAIADTPVAEEVNKYEAESEERNLLRKGIKGYFRRPAQTTAQTYGRAEQKDGVKMDAKKEEPSAVMGDVNPYTGKEYKTNSVRMHPSRIGYVQVYDREQHKWTDMTEWAFLGYQERKKMLLGKDYEPPIYLD